MDVPEGRRTGGSVMVFDISEQEYLNPGELIDRVRPLVQNEGAFVVSIKLRMS